MGKDDLRNATYVIDMGPRPSLPVAGSDARFPVGRIYCVGRNYADHAREMGHDPDREPPFFFMKAANSIVESGATIGYPVGTKDVHHEIEMVVALGKGGKDIPLERALDHVYGYAVGLDMTRRDLQDECKKAGRPWEIAKAFEHSAPIGDIVPAATVGHLSQGAIWLKVNGEIRQQGDLNQMIWKVPEMISYLSGLKPMTGAKIFSDAGGEPLAILCKATGLPRAALRALWRGLRRPETEEGGAPSVALERAITTYDMIAVDRAQTVLRYWNWSLSSALTPVLLRAIRDGDMDGLDEYSVPQRAAMLALSKDFGH